MCINIVEQQMIHIETGNNFEYGVLSVVDSGEIRGYQKRDLLT